MNEDIDDTTDDYEDILNGRKSLFETDIIDEEITGLSHLTKAINISYINLKR